MVEALGKVGGDDALARLRALDCGDDAELARRRGRAILMIERDGARATASAVDFAAPLPTGTVVIARCRDGVAPLLAEELGPAATVVGPGAVRVDGARTLGEIARARTLVSVGARLPLGDDDDPAAAIADALAAPPTLALLSTLTVGPIRWRLDVAGAGHRRGLVWRTAQAVSARAPSLTNDPTQTTWDVVVDLGARALELRPRRLPDDRFPWRVRDVPAASHPTIAAALARLASARADDVVWDPFCGSGSELIERARLGPARTLVGTDLSDDALAAAAANVAAAGLTERIDLRRGDARQAAPPGVSLIITNPPLGRRLRGDVVAMLEAFLRHAATSLVPGGRLVWLTPIARSSDALLRELGLRLDRDLAVDLGGFDAPMQRWIK
ncbi:MAG: methyltransferase [Kofleriaceae bacterium]